MKHVRSALSAAALLTVAAGSAHAAYLNIIDPLNPTFTQALGVNNADLVVGYGNAANFNGFQVTRPFGAGNFTRENFPNPSPPPPAFITQVVGVDNAGNTVGFYVDLAGLTHGFTDIGGTFAKVDRPGTVFNQLLGINHNGNEIAGYSSATDTAGMTGQKAFSLVTGTTNYTDIDALLVAKFGPNFNSQATGVNDIGMVVGFYQPTSTTFSGFEDIGGTISSVTVPGSMDTQALGINDLGTIVGDYVNSAGVMHGFFDNSGVFTTFDPLGSTATTINGINDQGHAVGFYTAANGNTVGFITGVPEPATLVLFGSGLAGLALVRRSSKKSL